MLEIDSLLSLGLYNIDLWELETAEIQLDLVIGLGQNTDHHRWAEKATVCLSLVKSYLGKREEAFALAERIYRLIVEGQSPQYKGRFAYFIQRLGQTYANLGELSTAFELYERAIAYVESGHYRQVRANALSGLAEVYRLQGNDQAAFPRHNEAIEILEDIGARCDLAEAHCQLGLTLLKFGDDGSQALEHFAQSLQLFTDIGASRQVDRVRGMTDELQL